jgi:hypothetical protein
MKMYGFGDVVERSGLRKLASDLDLNATIFLLCRWAPVGFAAQDLIGGDRSTGGRGDQGDGRESPWSSRYPAIITMRSAVCWNSPSAFSSLPRLQREL